MGLSGSHIYEKSQSPVLHSPSQVGKSKAQITPKVLAGWELGSGVTLADKGTHMLREKSFKELGLFLLK